MIAFNPQAKPRLRLFCFPYAGGDANIFRNWAEAMPEGVEVLGVQYPGRGTNLELPPFSDCDALASQLVEVMTPWLGVPFAFFGHSNGTLIRFEVARRLDDALKGRMRHHFVSARCAPYHPNNMRKISGLNDEEFLQAIPKMGGTPPEVLNGARLMHLLLPRLRADFALGERYVFRPGPALVCDVSILRGERDDLVDGELVQRCSELTTGTASQHAIEGGHFFLNSHKSHVMALVRATLLERVL